ncbi:Mn2+ and Fe2+ transporters of the NRAMP family [Spirosomataceae bacterium TFI 002]|nr:Mn2+ and Fe2+ transporters of the NRAMP family [Spirosomataceae bacterium TFI 002]
MQLKKGFFSSVIKILLSLGPAFMAIGFTIGTGSVTSMTVAGSRFGMQLLWVLCLSCIFSYVLIEAYGRFALVTGFSALNGIRKNLKYGKVLAVFIIIGIGFGQMNSLIGILGITSNAIYEMMVLFVPAIKNREYETVLVIALLIISCFYFLIWKGSYTVFEKILLIMVVVLGTSFLISFFVVLPSSKEIVRGMIPSVPDVPGGKMLVAAFVGTTMASATFISRPLFIKGKGWKLENLKDQRKDAILAVVLIFVISGSIMAVASSVLFEKGIVVNKVLDMIYTLEPVAGKFAVVVFFFGIVAAGLSSIFPILMITPLMIADFQNGELDVSSKRFKLIAGLSCLIGLAGVLWGGNPIQIQVLSQVFNVFILPLVIVCILVLSNIKSLMGKYKASLLLNIGMILALVFSLVVSYNGLVSVIDYFAAI